MDDGAQAGRIDHPAMMSGAESRVEQRAESRAEQSAERRAQRAESREQRTKSRVDRAEQSRAEGRKYSGAKVIGQSSPVWGGTLVFTRWQQAGRP